MARLSSFRGSPAALTLVMLLGWVLGCAQGQVLTPEGPKCGDAQIDEGEFCDDGDANSDTEPDACRESCHHAGCGDGVVDTGEECDDGNTAVGDGCDATCTEEFVCGDNVCEEDKGENCTLCAGDCCTCGDGVCDAMKGETCNMCPSECCPNCGNGALDPGEACDDGNNTSGDGCNLACEDEDGQAECGNGLLEQGEACDDGNDVVGDGCSPACLLEYTCGNATCESMTGETCMLCPADCCPDCGDGNIDPGEECDGANLNNQSCTGACWDGGSLVCLPWCQLDWSVCTGTLPTCGDGVAECTEECDGADFLGQTCGSLGYADGPLSCTATCTIDTSVCGPLLLYLEENFDAGCPPAGWTLGGDWQCGAPSGVGPGGPYSPPNVIATQLAGNYNNNQGWTTAVVTTPPMNLGAATEPLLTFRAWVQTEGFSYDGFNVKVSTNGGTSWTIVNAVTPPYNLTSVGGEVAWGGDLTSSGYQVYNVDLAAYAGQTIQLRFAFRTDGSVTYPGVYIDDVVVSEASNVPVSIDTFTVPPAYVNTPYQVQFTKSGGSSTATWSITGGTNIAWLSIDAMTGVLSGTPALADVGPVTLTVRATDTVNPSNFDENTYNFAVSNILYYTSFEGACPAGWALTNDWECGVPTVVGPTSAYDGTQCLGTQIDGNYNNNLPWSTTATSPSISLAGVTTASLAFRVWMDTEGSVFDGMNLKVSVNGGAFQIVSTVSPAYTLTVLNESAWGGNQAALGWQEYTANLNAYAGQNIQLQFAFRTDGSVTYPGVYIDHVRVY